MPAPYSLDLRQKALAAVDRGEKKSHVSRFFKINGWLVANTDDKLTI